MAKIILGEVAYEGTVTELREMGVKFPSDEMREPAVKQLKVGNYAKVIARKQGHNFDIGEIVGIIGIYSDGSLRAGHMNESDWWAVSAEELVRATDEEVEAAKVVAKRKVADKKENDRWAKIGRNPGEFKRGDIVKVTRESSGHGIGTIGEVLYDYDLTDGIGPCVEAVRIRDGRMLNLHSPVKLITPVEARFDVPSDGDRD